MEPDILSRFSESCSEDIQKILSKKNSYIEYLQEALLQNTTLISLADYAVNTVSDQEDLELSDYFFAISNLQGIPDKAHDFFMDAMIFCEDRNIQFKNQKELKDYYTNKIRPLL